MPLKFLIMPAVQGLCLAGFALGGYATALGLGVFLVLAFACDFVEDRSPAEEIEEMGPSGRALLWTTSLLQIALIYSGLALTVGNGTPLERLGAAATVLFMTGPGTAFAAHELTHMRNRWDVELGRVMFALCLHPAVAVHHVYCHHRHVATLKDPLTARRGEPFVRYMRRSIPAQNREAWAFERARLRHRGRPAWHPTNRVLRGYAMSAVHLALVGWAFGPLGLVTAALGAAYAIRAFEAFNYMAHYGLIRVSGSPCEARHSWNSRRVISSGFMLNLTHHSHHHTHPTVPFHGLKADGDLPLLPRGPAISAVLVLFPTLWTRVMQPALEDWDRRFATEAERARRADFTVA